MHAALPLFTDGTAPLGQKGQRGVVLLHLKRDQRLTARELADRLGVSLNAARHHLKELEAEGLVEYQREHRGVGAPAFAYRLSAAGEALFPRRYETTLTAVLDQMVEREGRPAAVALLESYFAALARRVEGELTDATPAERLEAIRRVLSEEGYMAEVAAHGSGAILREHNCAIPAVAQRFPEICAAEARFLARVLGAEVDRREHLLSGCGACEYHVRFTTAQENS
jgi:DeoR family transcriptional regulator, suf operon transcriptional repressor